MTIGDISHRYRKFVAAFAGICLALAPAPAMAWGGDGHSIVAEIAQRRVSAETRRAIAELLGEGASLASVAGWADSVAERRPLTRSWHFVNIPVGAVSYDLDRDCPGADGGSCIVGAIRRQNAVLADRSAAKELRAEALKFLVHLVADAHQPLHCAQRGRDGGGSTVTVTFRGAQVSLHKLWDFELLDALSHDWGEHLDEILALNADDTASPSDDPAVWVWRSHRIAVRDAYALPADGVVDSHYEYRARTVIYARLALAGARLARLLDGALR